MKSRARSSARARRNPEACGITPSMRSTMEREYTGLHEGLAPRTIKCDGWAVPQGPIEAFGVATEIQYEKRIPGETPDYHHPWKFYAQPTLGLDANGVLQFKSGRYEVRRRGIEDRVPAGKKGSAYLVTKHVKAERWVTRKPARLTTLGKLRFLKYKRVGQAGPGAIKTLRFSPSTAPELAHDQDGNLHVVGGRYALAGIIGAQPMARRRSHRRHARRHVFANPSKAMSPRRGSKKEGLIEHTGKLALFGVGVLAVATGAAVVTDMALARASTWSPGMKAGTKIGVGLVGWGLMLGLLPKESTARAIFSTGILTGPGVDGGLDLYNMYMAPYIASALAPAATSGANAPPVNPSGFATLPSGAPASYAMYNAQRCAVG